MAFLVAYVTFSNRQEADETVERLLKENVIACANSFPIKSRYRWEGVVEENEEVAVIMKTRRENWQKLVESVERSHSYDVPCIMRFDVDSNRRYSEWVREESGP